MNLGSNKLTYLYLPAITLILCVIATMIDLSIGDPIRPSVMVLIPLMSILLYMGYKKRVWEEK